MVWRPRRGAACVGGALCTVFGWASTPVACDRTPSVTPALASSTTATPAPIAGYGYEAMLEHSHTEAADLLNRYLGSQNSADYYFLQYAFDGALSMYEADGSHQWLDWVVSNSFQIVQRARPMLDGELGWAWASQDGTPNKVTGDSILCEYQIARPMLRAARIAASLERYPYAREAAAVAAFVLDHVMAKWLDRRRGWAGGQRPEQLGRVPWVRSTESKAEWDSMLEKGARLDHPWLDTWSMAGELNVNAYLLTGRTEYRERALTLAALFKRRRHSEPDGAWLWDDGVDTGVWSEQGGNTAGGPDTGHANREAAWVVQGYLAHVGFDLSDVEGLVRTLEQRIVRSAPPPRFHNYLNGANTPYRGYAYNGSTEFVAPVFDGWARLSWVSPEAHRTFQALLSARQAGDDGHANAVVWADLSLPGHLALAAALQRK